MDQRILFIGALIVVCVVVASLVVAPPTVKQKSKKRIASIDKSKNARRSGSVAVTESIQKEKRKKLNEALSRFEENNEKKNKSYTLEQKIEQAGLNISKEKFCIASFIFGLSIGALVLITGQGKFVAICSMVVAGFGVPLWIIGMCRRRRQKKFVSEFANAIDIIVRGVKSGYPINECLQIIAQESPSPINEEFHQLTEGIRLGMSLEQVLDRMYERMPLPDVRYFEIVLLIQQQTGGNLAEALGNLSSVLRSRKMLQGKIQALAAEAKASAIIIGSLPIVVMCMVKIASPEYLEPLFATTQGNYILGAAGFWFCLGILVMRQMMQIKV